jgi:hypothetical protein
VAVWTHRAPLPLLADDMAYLVDACRLATPAALEWGPGYAAVYCALRQVFADPLHAFWAKQALVPLAGGALVYGLGLRFRLGPVLAPLAALWCVLALLAINGTVEVAFLLGLLACLCAASETRWGWIGFFVLVGLGFLVRVEYLVVIVSALALLLRGRDPGRRGGLASGGLVLAACLFLAAKAGAVGGSRGWFAFGQQFAVNYAEAHHLELDPLAEWRRVTGQAFPESASIGEALRENPRLAGWHVGYNAFVRLPRALAAVLVPVPSFVPWVAWRGFLAAAVMLMVPLAGVVAARAGRLDGQLFAPLLALATVPLVTLIFRPQARHLLPVLPLVVAVAGAGLSPGREARDGRLVSVLRPALACVLLLGLASAWVSLALAPSPRASLSGWIDELRREDRPRPVRLAASWYADRACGLVGPHCQAVGLDDLVDGHDADDVLIGPDWAARSDVQGDPRLRALLARPEAFGCTGDPPTAEGFRLLRCRPPLRLR